VGLPPLWERPSSPVHRKGPGGEPTPSILGDRMSEVWQGPG